MAFHEKAGRSQVGCFVFRGTKFVSPAEWPLIRPLYVPDRVDSQSCQCDQRQVSTQRRLSGVRPQRSTASSS